MYFPDDLPLSLTTVLDGITKYLYDYDIIRNISLGDIEPRFYKILKSKIKKFIFLK